MIFAVVSVQSQQEVNWPRLGAHQAERAGLPLRRESLREGLLCNATDAAVDHWNRMAMNVLQAEHRRPHEETEARTSVDAWLRRALADKYGAVADEALPDALLRLLPEA